MTREQAVQAYRRTKAWEMRATSHLLADLRKRGACDPIPLTLHNWGYCGGQEPYRTLHRECAYQQEQIWIVYRRLTEAFAKHF